MIMVYSGELPIMKLRPLIIAPLVLAPLSTCPAPDFQQVATPPSLEEQRILLPVFRVPTSDWDCPILGVFIDWSNPDSVELNVVTADEDNPYIFLDWPYDADRWWGIFDLYETPPYITIDLSSDGGHRVADVESIQYNIQSAPVMGDIFPDQIIFDGTWSDDQTWSTPFVLHYSKTYDGSEFELVDGRPVIYINTWNHLFSATNNNPNKALREIKDYPVYSGTRAEIESFYEAVWTDFGLDL